MNFLESLNKEHQIKLHFHNHTRIIQVSSSHLHVLKDRPIFKFKVTLRDLISSFHRKPLPEYMIQHAARMILEQLEALHSEGYDYCNLNPAKILLFPSNTFEEPFDLTLAVSHSDSMILARYMSPESFEPNGPIDSALSIYSLGCVVYEIFGGMSEQKIFGDPYEWFLFNEISPVAKDFLNRCHELHPKKVKPDEQLNTSVRPTAAELLNHPFITKKLTARQ